MDCVSDFMIVIINLLNYHEYGLEMTGYSILSNRKLQPHRTDDF